MASTNSSMKYRIRIEVKNPIADQPEHEWPVLALLYIPAGTTIEESNELLKKVKISACLSS